MLFPGAWCGCSWHGVGVYMGTVCILPPLALRVGVGGVVSVPRIRTAGAGCVRGSPGMQAVQESDGTLGLLVQELSQGTVPAGVPLDCSQSVCAERRRGRCRLARGSGVGVAIPFLTFCRGGRGSVRSGQSVREGVGVCLV